MSKISGFVKTARRRAVAGKNRAVMAARYLADRRFLALASAPDRGELLTYRVSAGLANRLRAHYLAACLADRLGRRLRPVWLETGELASDGDDLFPGGVERGGVGLPKAALIGAALARSDRLSEVRERSRGRLLVLDFDAQWQGFETSRAEMDAEQGRVLTIRRPIGDEAAALVAELPQPYLAVHVRQTDFITHTDNARPLGYFEDQIIQTLAAHPKGAFAALLIASDDAVVLSPEVAARFGHVRVLRPTLERTSRGVAAEALTHLLVLAGGAAFIPSPKSSFSEFVLALRGGLIVLDFG